MHSRDRRYIRTERLLHAAMQQLLQDQDYETITVEGIAARADIARKTFYAHYRNKEELLLATMEGLFNDIVMQMQELDPDTLLLNGKPLSYPIFLHVHSYARFYRSALSEKGSMQFMVRLWSYIAEVSYSKHSPLRSRAPHMQIPPELIAEMITGAAIGSVRWWLATGMVESPETMAYTFSQVIAPGVLLAMCLDAV
jgi:AcrR family transcriptional regulator